MSKQHLPDTPEMLMELIRGSVDRNWDFGLPEKRPMERWGERGWRRGDGHREAAHSIESVCLLSVRWRK